MQIHAFLQSREVNIHMIALIKTIFSFLQPKGIFLFRLSLTMQSPVVCMRVCKAATVISQKGKVWS